jgi:NAD(P)-dependent dehydrogenase (short-subunit alcohol dehydrogenase family)
MAAGWFASGAGLDKLQGQGKRSMKMLDGKVVVVTGAGSGIGEASAKVFAGHGARLVVTDSNGETAGQVAAAIRAASGDAIDLTVDVSDEARSPRWSSARSSTTAASTAPSTMPAFPALRRP